MFVHFTIKLRAGKDIFIDVQGKDYKKQRETSTSNASNAGGRMERTRQPCALSLRII